MATWRNLVAVAAGILAIGSAPVFAHSHSHRSDPWPRDPAAILMEDPAGARPAENFPKISAEKTGTVPAKDGRLLRVNLELGNVHVFTDASSQISYRAIVETDSRDPDAERFVREFRVTARPTSWGVALDARVPWQILHSRFDALVEIHIPRRFSLEVSTGGGNIDVADIDGRVRLTSAGGNIAVGNVGGVAASGPAAEEAASIETQGGRISVGNVAGMLRASTAGGHIIAGNITGDVTLRTGGGQIYTGHVAGAASLDSGGGNIHIESAASSVAADSGGGGLEVRQANTPLHVTANDGGITAWLSAINGSKAVVHGEVRKLKEISQMSSAGGDIVLYIPRKLAATIDAVIEQGEGHHIAADPSLPLKISYPASSDGGRTIHCAVQVNGGGEVVRLRAASGNIALRPAEAYQYPGVAFATAAGQISGGLFPASLQPSNPAVSPIGPDDLSDADGFFADMRRRILESWWGGIPVDATEMQRHLEHSVAPAYPDVARQAGVEGDVVLRVYVSSSGQVTGLKVLDGPPILARAAIQAVQQWQYQAPKIDGRPTSVVTTLVISFRLQQSTK
ncbi:MAG TPA: energy transducer TonB [Candidatus Acidoferrales bacterium]|nr:energy transducer TonB [Candidatus Acidoferrales bacterium]